jgi:hypothetical protein
MRARSRAHHVGSTMICWRCHCFSVDGNVGAKPSELFARSRRDDIVANQYGDAIGGLYRVGALQPVHDSTLPRSNGIAVAERVFLVL